MNKVVAFLKSKTFGEWASVATALLTVFGLIFYACLISVSFETTEAPAAVIVLGIVTIALAAVAFFKDFFQVVTIAECAAAFITFSLFVKGRVSYFAFYITGDVMDTGLSPFFVIAAGFFVLAMVSAVIAFCLSKNKNKYINQEEKL